jgi:hypothetical protein
LHGGKGGSPRGNAVDGAGAAVERSKGDRRCGAGDVQTDVLKFGIYVDRIGAANDQPLIEFRVVGEADAGFEILVIVADRRNRGLGQRQRSAPQRIGPGLGGDALVMKLVDRLAKELPPQAQIEREAGVDLPIVLEIEAKVFFYKGNAWVPLGNCYAARTVGAAACDEVGQCVVGK